MNTKTFKPLYLICQANFFSTPNGVLTHSLRSTALHHCNCELIKNCKFLLISTNKNWCINTDYVQWNRSVCFVHCFSFRNTSRYGVLGKHAGKKCHNPRVKTLCDYFKYLHYFFPDSIHLPCSKLGNPYLPLQHFDRWACTPKILHDKILCHDYLQVYLRISIQWIMIFENNIHWYMYNYFEINIM